MPYDLEYKPHKGYKLHLKDDPEHVFSKKYQSKKKAMAQMKAIEISKRKRKQPNISGGGVADVFAKIKNTVNKIINVPKTVASNVASKLLPVEKTQYTDKTRGMIEKYGGYFIESLSVEKEPVNANVMRLAGMLTGFELQAIMQKAGIDKFYHISMVIQVLTELNERIKLRIEKNENITIEIYKKRPNTQSINVDLKGQKLTMKEILEKTRLAIGNDHYFLYRFHSWNCADFILQILQANGILTQADRDFIWQNADVIRRNMSQSSQNRMLLITKLGSYVSHLKGGAIRFI